MGKTHTSWRVVSCHGECWGSLSNDVGDRAVPALREGMATSCSEHHPVMGCEPGGACSFPRDSELLDSSVMCFSSEI